MASFRVAKSDEVLEGKALEAVIGNEIIAIFRSNAKLYALDGMCAHQGGPLALGRIQNDCVTCPWHGWQYHLADGNNAATCKPMLRTYDVREVAGEIFIEIPEARPTDS